MPSIIPRMCVRNDSDNRCQSSSWPRLAHLLAIVSTRSSFRARRCESEHFLHLTAPEQHKACIHNHEVRRGYACYAVMQVS